jgi:hypothetical protein
MPSDLRQTAAWWSGRARLAGLHACVSAVVLLAVLLAVVLVWYPPPLYQLQGLGAILLLLGMVDACLGPLATLVIAGPRKPARELKRDISVIAALQLAALIYGVWTIHAARPAYVVFNADRFDVVAATDVAADYFGKPIDGPFARLPQFGPQWVFSTQPDDVEERNAILFSATAGGADIKNFPNLYRPWPGNADVVRGKARPVRELLSQHPEMTSAVTTRAKEAGLSADQVLWLPIMGRESAGVVLLDGRDLSRLGSLASQ